MKFFKPEYLVKKYSYLVLFVIFSSVTFILFYSSLNNFFLADDFWYLLKISKRSWLFSLTQFYSHFDPLPVLLNKVIYSVWDFSPVPYRALLFIGHAISCVVVYKISAELFVSFDEDKSLTRIQIKSLLCSAIFCLMQIHTESIIYINGHHEMAFSVFVLISFYFYLAFKNYNNKKNKALIYVFFILAFLSKENAVIFLPVIIVMELIFYRVKFMPALKNFYPLAIIAAVYTAVRIFLYNDQRLGLSYSFKILDVLSESIKNILFTLTAFIFSLDFIRLKEVYRSCQENLICVAANLAGKYPTGLAAILLTILIYLALVLKRSKIINIGMLFILVTVIPFMWLAGYERYLYLPSVGFALIAGQYLGNIYFQGPAYKKFLASILLICFFAYNVYSIEGKKENYRIASGIAYVGINEIIRVSTPLPLNSDVYFRNLPDNYNGAWIFRDGVQYFAELYLNRTDLSFNKIYGEDVHTDLSKNVFVFNYSNGKLNLEN